MDQDKSIEVAIHQAMISDKRLSAQAIQVAFEDGVVQLHGTVQSFRRAVAAVDLASSWPGVVEVVNNLRVEPPINLSDAQVANNVRTALDSSEDVVKDAITVSVSSGVAKLAGSVADAWQFMIAEDIARSARGVRDVRNLLVASVGSVSSDEELAREIQATICRICGEAAVDIRVAVNGHKVVLSGTARTQAQKSAARDVVRRFGLLHIRNDILVVPKE